MKKRFMFTLSSAFVLILSSVVMAQGSNANGTVLDKLWGMLKFLFFDFSQSGEATIVTGLKFFMFVLLFALLYGLSEAGPLHKMSKNIRIVLSLSLSAMTVLLVPSQLVIALASAYSAVFFGGLLAALILAAVFLVFKTFHEPTVANKFTKAIICGIFTGVVGSFSDLTKTGIGFKTMDAVAMKSLSSINNVAEFVTLVFFVLTLVYLGSALFGLSKPHAVSAGSTVVGAAGSAGSSISNWFSNKFGKKGDLSTVYNNIESSLRSFDEEFAKVASMSSKGNGIPVDDVKTKVDMLKFTLVNFSESLKKFSRTDPNWTTVKNALDSVTVILDELNILNIAVTTYQGSPPGTLCELFMSSPVKKGSKTRVSDAVQNVKTLVRNLETSLVNVLNM